MQDISDIIIGGGEIGNSLYNTLSAEYACDIYDLKYGPSRLEGLKRNEYDYMHICFPYNDKFIESVENYKKIFKPKHVIVHSTVPVGTCNGLGVMHSPCIGIHPDLTVSMKTFTKFISGGTSDARAEVANHFRRAGMTIYLTDKSESTELAKIMCTTYYGINVEITKEIKRLCDKFGVPFEFWTLWNNNYNQGYIRLNHPEYVRQNLVPMMSEQGGHCTINNTLLLENNFTRLLNFLNYNPGKDIDFFNYEN